MAISITRYVDIVSGLGAGANVPNRDLVARLFTANNLLPPQTFISFTTAAEVGTYFGFASEEYLRAVFYFSWISKNQTQAQSIQFARWVKTAVAPMIFPIQNNGTALASWTAISNGSFILTMGGFTFILSGLDFTAAASLADVASDLQTAIRAESGGGAVWTSATVTYSSAYGGFLLVGGATDVVTHPVVVEVSGIGTDITPAGLLGWLPEQTVVNGNLIAGAIWASGSAAETITATLTSSSQASNNFGSFAFLTNLGLTQQNVVDAATWNNTQNVLYMFSQAVTPANAVAWQAAVAAIGGIGLTLSPPITTQLTATVTSASNVVSGITSNAGLTVGMPVTGSNIPAGTYITSLVGTTGLTLNNNATGSATEQLTFATLQFPEMFPMMIEAATNYAGLNSVQNYEFQQVAGLTPSVSSDTDANTYDALAINYYGVTQQAGTLIAFYQQGVLQGASVVGNITDMNAYVNEIWLKDAATVAIMTLLLSLSQVPANNQGRNQILAILQGVVNQALNNGTISVGKSLTVNQQMFITSETNDPLAWYQVQNSGYWLDVVITASGSSPVVYTATYTLVYSKDDIIRKVNGTHTLI
jgi:hypothetical protein